MQSSRVKNTKRNIIVTYLFAGFSFVFQFIMRTIIVKVLGEDYLGLSSLFTSILTVLNMAELGFSGAIVYNMYKPIANGDTGTVCALLQYYKKIYRIVGIVVLVCGIAISPFVPKLIKGAYPADTNIYILYFLYLLNTAVSYFLFAYKDSLLFASQRVDLSKLAHGIVEFLQYILQILALIFFKNYYLYMVILVLCTAGKNILAAVFAKRHFPEYVCRGEITPATKKDVISRVKGLLVCNISATTYSTFDSIIISTFIGLTSVAIYNNYILIFTSAGKLLGYIRNAMQASVGDSVAKEDMEKNYRDMLQWQYLFSGIAMWCVTCMYNLFQPFMTLWMGENMLLTMTDVALLSGWFAVSVVQHAYFLYLAGNGLWWELRWPYIFSTVFNLIANIVLGKLLGVTGILLASFLSNLFFCYIWQAAIVFKVYFKRTVYEYMKRQCWYFLLMAVSCACASFCCTWISVGGIAGIALKGILCTFISMALFVLFTLKTANFKNAVSFVRHIVKI